MTLNIIFVLIIVTHAQGFESIKKYGGQGPLAAPYQSADALGAVCARFAYTMTPWPQVVTILT